MATKDEPINLESDDDDNGHAPKKPRIYGSSNGCMFANQDLPHVACARVALCPSVLHVRLINFDLPSHAGARELYRASFFWFEDSRLQKLLVREMRDSRPRLQGLNGE